MNLDFLKNNDPRRQPGLKEVEEKIEEISWLEPREKEKIWEQLNVAFSGTPDRSDNEAWRAFWYFYTDFSWKTLRARDHKFFVEVAIGRQLPMATILGVDVLDEIFKYLNIRTIDPTDMESFYAKSREAFFNSEAKIGQIDGQDFTVKDLLKKMRYLNSVRDSSLEEAKFRDDLQRAMFPKKESFLNKYFDEDRAAAVTTMLNVTDFFIGVEPDGIWYLVEDYANSETPETVPRASSPSSPPPALPKEAAAPMPPAPEKPDYAAIRHDIEQKFSKDAQGDFVDLDGVLDELEDLAEKYHDDKISELYYFDEDAGEFKWNEESL